MFRCGTFQHFFGVKFAHLKWGSYKNHVIHLWVTFFLFLLKDRKWMSMVDYDDLMMLNKDIAMQNTWLIQDNMFVSRNIRWICMGLFETCGRIPMAVSLGYGRYMISIGGVPCSVCFIFGISSGRLKCFVFFRQYQRGCVKLSTCDATLEIRRTSGLLPSCCTHRIHVWYI